MSEDSVREFLRILAQADATAGASPDTEVRLRNAFRRRNRMRRLQRAAVWGSVAVAASLVLTLALVNQNPPRQPANVVAEPVVSAPPQPVPTPAPIDEVPVAAPRKRVAVQPSRPAETVTEFFPLMDPAPPFGRGQLLRIELPASAMQMVGLPVHEQHMADPVQADVLVGEEGLPRAIRFVKFDTNR